MRPHSVHVAALLTFVSATSLDLAAQRRFAERSRPNLPPTVESTGAVAFGDLDGDGDVDLLKSGSAGLRALLNDGQGNFQDASAGLPLIYYAGPIALGDIDGDGDLDIACGAHLLTNDGTGSFTDVTSRGCGIPGLLAPLALEFVDVDADGDLDLLSANAAGGGGGGPSYTVNLCLNDGAGAFSDRPLSGGAGFVVGDVDADGDPDVVVSVETRAQLLLNDGRGNFRDVTSSQLPPDTSAWRGSSGTMGDVDQDGDLDLVLGNRLLLNDGTGRFVDGTTLSLPTAGYWAMDVACVDVDQDHDLDLLFAVYLGQNHLFLNDGLGVFVDATTTHMPIDSDRSTVLAYADIDGDSDVDIVFGNGDYGRPEQDRMYVNLTRQVDTRTPPLLGQSFVIDAYVRPARGHVLDLAMICVATGHAALPIPGLGTLALDPNQMLVFPPQLVGASGSTSVTLSIPQDPQLVGTPLHAQALAIPRSAPIHLTNATSDVIRQ